MSTLVTKHAWLLALAVGLVVPVSPARAQCSRGGGSSATAARGAPTLSSFSSAGTRGLNMPVYARAPLNVPTGFDMQRQLQLMQRQFAASRLAARQRQSMGYQDGQSLLSMRRERAERTRQRRTERIARAKAKREAERANVLDTEGATMLVSLTDET